MPKRKKEYQVLVDYLQGELSHPEKEAKSTAVDIYNLWNVEENLDKNIVTFYKECMKEVEDTFAEGSPVNARGDDQTSENQAEESSAKQEEETHDQNLKNKISDSLREKMSEPIESRKATKIGNSTPAKFDWEKYLEENPQFKTKDKDSGVEVLLLQFFKDIAHKEGFLSVRYSPLGNADQGYCGVSCEIEWPNLPRVSSGLADAHFNNCHSFTKYYVSPMAENRSFIRAVKQYFNIPYLGKDEIGQTPKDEPKSEEAPTGPYVTLKKAAKDKLNIASFDGFKSFLRKQVKENPETAWLQPEEYQDWADYNDWQEIKKPKILELINKIKV